MRRRDARVLGALFSCGREEFVVVTENTNPAMSSVTRSLTSWKEIAHYLGVNVRTAQKWERDKGLPVRRSSGSRSRVSADAASLDTWRQQQSNVANHEEHCYRWPLGSGFAVEVRFEGDGPLVPAHIDLFREYLELFKNALG